MWVRLVKRYPLFISDKILGCLRWHGKNASNSTVDCVSDRMHNERYLITSSFFDGVSSELLVEGFEDLLVSKNPPTMKHCDIEKTLILVTSQCDFSTLYKIVGLRQLYGLLARPRHQLILARDYGINHIAFQQLLAQAETFRHALKAPGTAAQIAILQQAVSKRDAEIATLEHAASERGTRIAFLEKAASERDAILASTSWRVTAPLRLAGRLIGKDSPRRRY
jgi:hypothetical protein